MKREYNHMVFDTTVEEEINARNDLMNYLLNYNMHCRREYLDIHVYQEEVFTIIEWTQVPYSHDWGGEFKFVGDDELVVKEVRFPDGHYDYALDEDHEKELWENFHKENPGWVKTSYGTWTNEIENEKFRKENGLE